MPQDFLDQHFPPDAIELINLAKTELLQAAKSTHQLELQLHLVLAFDILLWTHNVPALNSVTETLIHYFAKFPACLALMEASGVNLECLR